MCGGVGVILLKFVLSAGAIFVAGSFLTRFADAIAEFTGLGRLLVGSVLLAGATSLPELSVDLSAIKMQLPDLAVGDLLGSCLLNLMILAALDLMHGSHRRMFTPQSAAHALAGLLSIALLCIVGVSLLTTKLTEHHSIFGVGPGMLLVIVGYVLGVRVIYIDQRVAAQRKLPQPSESATSREPH